MPPPIVYILILIHFGGFEVLSSLGHSDLKVLEGFWGHRVFKVFKDINPRGLVVYLYIYEPGGYKVYYTLRLALCQVFL